MAKPFLSVIIPAYNEAERLPLTLVDIDQKLDAADYDYEILVVNDGSKDSTAAIIRAMTKGIKNIKLIDNDTNKGRGAAVRQGMLLARGKLRLLTDADNSASIDQFDAMLPHFKGGYEIVIASRTLPESKLYQRNPIREIMGKLSNLVIQAVLLPKMWDTQCGFKAFTEEAAEKIFSMSRIPGWGFDAEVLALGRVHGYKIKEIPIVWRNNKSSRVNAAAYLKTLLEIARIRTWLWLGSYREHKAK